MTLNNLWYLKQQHKNKPIYHNTWFNSELCQLVLKHDVYIMII
jgi:hypothetical protein